VPIAVRHIESVMRMAEASAKMHLRDHVREDDTDLAIKVMLESFLQAQKVSVRKSLQRNFKKYITFGEEINQLLMHQLQGLVRLQEKYQRVSFCLFVCVIDIYICLVILILYYYYYNRLQIKTGVVGSEVEVPLEELEVKARELNIFDLSPFFESSAFKRLGFSLHPIYPIILKKY
jgi:DNA replication licensing factor MCM2